MIGNLTQVQHDQTQVAEVHRHFGVVWAESALMQRQRAFQIATRANQIVALG